MRRAHRGVLLIELVVVVSLSAVFALIAMPQVGAWRQAMQARQWMTQYQAGLGQLRARAVREGRAWTLCVSSDGRQCDSIWRGDWLAFADLDQDGRHQSGEPTALFLPAIPGGWQVVWRGFRATSWLQWQANGDAATSNGTLTLCPPTAQDAALRQLVLSKSGRLRLVQPSQAGGSTLQAARAACGWP